MVNDTHTRRRRPLFCLIVDKISRINFVVCVLLSYMSHIDAKDVLLWRGCLHGYIWDTHQVHDVTELKQRMTKADRVAISISRVSMLTRDKKSKKNMYVLLDSTKHSLATNTWSISRST